MFPPARVFAMGFLQKALSGRRRKDVGHACAWLLVWFLSGCATNFEIAPQRTVDIVVVAGSPPELIIGARNKAISGDAAVGATSGGAVGALAGLSCGPWFPFCSAAGYLAGLVVGGAAGAGVGVIESWSPEQADRLRERLVRFGQQNDVVSDLRSAIAERAKTRWTLAVDPNSVIVRVELMDLSVHMLRAERGVLYARARVESVLPEDPRYGPSLRQIHEFVGAPLTARAWAEMSDDDMRMQFRRMQLYFADYIYLDLGGR